MVEICWLHDNLLGQTLPGTPPAWSLLRGVGADRWGLPESRWCSSPCALGHPICSLPEGTKHSAPLSVLEEEAPKSRVLSLRPWAVPTASSASPPHPCAGLCGTWVNICTVGRTVCKSEGQGASQESWRQTLSWARPGLGTGTQGWPGGVTPTVTCALELTDAFLRVASAQKELEHQDRLPCVPAASSGPPADGRGT